MATPQQSKYVEPTAMPAPTGYINRWWRVAGGLSMNLALGSLYAWSVFVAPLEKDFGWKRADTAMIFTIAVFVFAIRSEEHTSELQSLAYLVCRLLLEKKKPYPN